MALWVYLSSWAAARPPGAARITSRRDRGATARPPPDEIDLDHVLACYRTLQARRPELAAGEILQNIAVELKRAKRAEAERRFYREAIDGAPQLDEVAGVLGWPASAATSRG